MAAPLCIVGLGEAVFDIFPDKEVLGGTSLNLALQSHQLLAPHGGSGVLVSRVGNDALGHRLVAQLQARGLSDKHIQRDDAHPTGRVLVSFEDGAPRFEIVLDCAWDHIAFGPHEAALARRCGAVCFGTLAQRHPVARASIEAFVCAAPQALRLFDVNLRMQLFTPAVLAQGCRMAQLVKLNEDELPVVSQLLGVAPGDSAMQAEALRRQFDLEAVIYTRGPRGTVAYTREGCVTGKPAHFAPQPGADAVGAGDACSAGLLAGRLLGMDWQGALDLANAAGAYVASRPGATPSFDAAFMAGLPARKS